jgi:glutamine amidotransferase
MITIIDYKVGNLGSIKNMLKKIGEQSIITSDPLEVNKASKLILPGVGAFDNGIKNLKDLGLWDVLNKKVIEEKTPILGICLGAQLMTKCSEEGVEHGFGWVDADTIRFKIEKTSKLKVPSMGWYDACVEKESNLITKAELENPRFYFVHSYHFECHDKSDILTTSFYSYSFASAFEKGNVLGVQFHPEKSHKFGMQLLRNFTSKY